MQDDVVGSTPAPTLLRRAPARREWWSFTSLCVFAVTFFGLCIVDAHSIAFALLLPLTVVPVATGPRAYRIAAIVCLVVLVWRGVIQIRRERHRETHLIHDHSFP